MILIGLALSMKYGTQIVVFSGFIAAVNFILILFLCMFCNQANRIKIEEKRFHDKLKEMGLDEETLRRKKEKEKREKERE
jgi:preprotein translocase subunit YajC